MAIKIPLTQGKFAIIDEEDFEAIGMHKWYYGAGYALRKLKRKTIRMHSVINKTPDGYETDHIDGNGLNNQKLNLRNATRHNNVMNTNSRRNSSSKYKGVSWKLDRKKWLATICFNKKDIHLGYFISEIEAALAYNKAALKYFGEFAKLNIIT